MTEGVGKIRERASGHAGPVLARVRGKILQAQEEVECIGLVGAKSQEDEAGNLRKGLIVG